MIAAITGYIAEVYYDIDKNIVDISKKYLTDDLYIVLDKFNSKYVKRK